MTNRLGSSIGRLAGVLTLAAAIAVGCSGKDGAVTDALPTAPPESASPPANQPQADGGAPVADASRADAHAPAPTTDAAPGAGCPALSTSGDDGARFAVARRSTKTKTIDGDFGDFDGCTTAVLDLTTAARIKGTPTASAKVMIEWEPSALWIAADVVDATLEGTHPDHPYLNDSLELYVSSTGYRTGDFGPTDHQVVVDYKDVARLYPGGTALAPKATARSFPTATGYRVEMRVDAMFAFGKLMAKGDVRFFDMMINDGADQAQFLVWAMQPHAACACTQCQCNRSPALDTLLWAPLTLL